MEALTHVHSHRAQTHNSNAPPACAPFVKTLPYDPMAPSLPKLSPSRHLLPPRSTPIRLSADASRVVVVAMNDKDGQGHVVVGILEIHGREAGHRPGRAESASTDAKWKGITGRQRARNITKQRKTRQGLSDTTSKPASHLFFQDPSRHSDQTKSGNKGSGFSCGNMNRISFLVPRHSHEHKLFFTPRPLPPPLPPLPPATARSSRAKG